MAPLRHHVPALRHENFRRYAAGQSVSLVGFWMQNVAQSWLVYRLSGSELVLGVVALLAHLPMLLLSPVAGVVADRLDKQRVILVTQATAMVLALGLWAVLSMGWESVPVVAVAATALGIVGAFDLPTRQSFLVELVGPGDLPSAVAVNASIFNTARVVGPAVAGVLVARVGEAPCFLLNGVSYVAALWAIGGMRFPHRRTRAASTGTRGDLAAGLRYVWARRDVRALLAALGVVSAFAFQANVLMPSLAVRRFGTGAEGFGGLLTAFGIGAVLSALLLAVGTRTRVDRRRDVVGGLLVYGAGLALVAASPRLVIALVGQLVAGLGMIRFTVVTNASVQILVEDAYRGRVMGIHTVMFAGMAPVGSLVLGALAESFGPQRTLMLSAAVTIATAVLLGRALRRAR